MKTALALPLALLLLAGCGRREPPLLTHVPVPMERVIGSVPFGTPMYPGFSDGIDYWMDGPDVAVRASAAGVVSSIDALDDGHQFAVTTSPRRKSWWSIQYNPVADVRVNEGDWVEAGDVIGFVGRFGVPAWGTGISVRRAHNGEAIAYCPFDYASLDFVLAHQTVTNDWCRARQIDADR